MNIHSSEEEKNDKIENDTKKNLEKVKTSSYINCILYHFLFSLKLFTLKYTFSNNISIINFIFWKSLFSIILIILRKKGFNKPSIQQNFNLLIFRLCGQFFNLLFLILMIKNLKLFSIGLIIYNSLFTTIITKNKIFICLNLISLFLNGFSYNILNYFFVFGHCFISIICIYSQGKLFSINKFSIENQNLISNLISIIITLLIAGIKKKFNFDIYTISFSLIYVFLSFLIEKNIFQLKGNKYFNLFNLFGLLNLYLLGLIIFKEKICITDIISLILITANEFMKLILSKKDKQKSE